MKLFALLTYTWAPSSLATNLALQTSAIGLCFYSDPCSLEKSVSESEPHTKPIIDLKRHCQLAHMHEFEKSA